MGLTAVVLLAAVALGAEVRAVVVGAGVDDPALLCVVADDGAAVTSVEGDVTAVGDAIGSVAVELPEGGPVPAGGVEDGARSPLSGMLVAGAEDDSGAADAGPLGGEPSPGPVQAAGSAPSIATHSRRAAAEEHASAARLTAPSRHSTEPTDCPSRSRSRPAR